MLIRYSGSSQLSQLDFVCNTPEVGLFSNVEANCKRGLQAVDSCPPTDQPAVIVGSGPSVVSTLEMIREMKERGAKLYALNNAARYLSEKGIEVDTQVILDAREYNLSFVDKKYAGEVLLASQCHPSLFDQCEKIDYPVRLWHALIEGMEKYIPQEKPLLIGGGLTVGLSSLCLVYTLGHRNIHLFGYDSCHSGDKGHVLHQSMNDKDEHVQVAVANRRFDCSLMMAGQAHSFQRVAEMLADLGCEITLHGDGLIPHMMAERQRLLDQKVLTAVYDLGLSPPTYDFMVFLVEAHKYATENGYTDIDIVFQPGPMYGFRDDDLPPDRYGRQMMLDRVCVAGSRLCPMVRNISVLKERKPIEGDVFPEGWTSETPVSHYGAQYVKGANRVLQASPAARRAIAKRFSIYATITMRTATYWPERNSNEKEWRKVADWLETHRITPVFVYDAEDPRADCYSWDIDLRMALYEGAVVNLGVSNGPMCLCYLSDAPYLVFKMITESCKSTSKDFLASHGIDVGDQFGPNGRIVWKEDFAQNIIAELDLRGYQFSGMEKVA